ncbi:DUF6162 family protein [Alkalimarinus alittae]|uniref:Uncharacterized protein n=1 Tax=Alkalimarinus alittae TaxID=2961619 RepID=A0ABY6N4M6_9ALTE|nr:hypothetical protein [Alkalimarinus alittae]UZE97078.1 hypothetical protein NKI27_04830 [Alkalimarinus alittae]
MTASTDFFVEKVHPANGRGEDPIVAALIVVVLAVAALLLWLRQPPEVVVAERVPDEVRQVLTELSVAATEIKMMAELDEKVPTIEVLQASGVTPFANAGASRWVEVQSGCYLGIRGSFGFRLIGDSRLTHISWRKMPPQFVSNIESRLDNTLCNAGAIINNEGNWNIYESLQLVHQSTDDKHLH